MEKLEPEDNWTTARIQSLLDDEIPEDFRLDYKGSESIPSLPLAKKEWGSRREEIGKDVSAFANSDGGILIYGIAEKEDSGLSIPSHFQPIDSRIFTPEGLAQIIADNVEPTIMGIRVLPVMTPCQTDPNMVCYVVIVPKGDTAHMAKDGRYYYRNESTSRQMRDWQVRDTMNRNKWPNLDARIQLWEARTDDDEPCLKIHVAVTNSGGVICREYAVQIIFPTQVFGNTYDVPEGIAVDTSRGTGFELIISNHGKRPLFPSMTAFENLVLPRYDPFRLPLGKGPLVDEFFISVFADSMPPKRRWESSESLQLGSDELLSSPHSSSTD